jgi:ribosomal protein L3 glutamine methyltransferase
MNSVAFPASPPRELATVGDWWRFTISSLNRANARFGQGTVDAAQDASFLVLGALGLPLGEFDRFRDYRITGEEQSFVFECLRKRCVERTPSAYVLGFTEQCGVRFSVDPRVLIPRSYLGELIANGLEPWVDDADAELSVLDLCTGSGCLAILAAYAFPNALVAASDLSSDALTVAKENMAAHDLTDEIQLQQGDLFAPWAREKFDIIVSNPPYVTDSSMEALPPEFLKEPQLALSAGVDGCDVLARMLDQAKRHLTPDGRLFVDVGHNRALVEMRFPKLPFSWLVTEGADDGVFMLSRQDLAG